MRPVERVMCALSHNEPDRVPWDFWATPEMENALINHLGLSNPEELLRHLDVDFRYYRGPSYIGISLKTDQEDVSRDLWGVHRKLMTVEGGSYNWTYGHVVYSPLEKAETAADVDNYQYWPSPDSWDYTNVSADCSQFDGYVVIYAGDRLDRTSQLKPAMYLRGMEQIYMDLYENPEVAEAIISHVRDYFLDYNEKVFLAAKGKIDIFMTGDDFGTQNGLMMSRELWCKYFKKGFKAYIDLAHKYNMKVMHHTCGAVSELIPEFIDCGLDILQSVQPRANGMDLKTLKQEYGKHISFHGSMDIQHTLPHGTPEDIRAEVKDRMEAGKPGGGFIISTAHNIQPDTPMENVLALFDAYREFGKYT